MRCITTITQMVREPVSEEIRKISEQRYQRNILIDKDGSIKEGIKDAEGESKRHAYVSTVYEYWARKMNIISCYFIEDHIDYDCDVITKNEKTEVKTKNIEVEKVWGLYSQRLHRPNWSILIPKRSYDQKPNIWIFGGCYDNYTMVELFGWLTDEVYRKVRKEYLKGEIKNRLLLDKDNWDVNFLDMYPMSELLNYFSIQQPKQYLSVEDLDLGELDSESIYTNLFK